MSEASPTPLSVKDRIALLKSTPSPPVLTSNTATSRPKSTNNIAEKLAALKATSEKSAPTSSSLASPAAVSASISSSSSAVSVSASASASIITTSSTGSESATKTPSKDRSKSLLSDKSAISILGENAKNTPSPKDLETVGTSNSIEDRIAALKISTPVAATAAASFTSPSTEVNKNANSASVDINESQSTPASNTTAKAVRKGSIADRIAALKNEPGGDLFSPSGESLSSASFDSVVNKNSISISSSGVQSTEEQDSNAKSTAKSNEAKRISTRFNNVGFNPFGPRPTPTSSTASAAEAATTTESEVKKSEHSDAPKEIVHLSMSRPTIAAGRRKGKNTPSVAVFSADTDSVSSASPVKTAEGAAI